MKRWVILLILVIPLVYAENYDQYVDLVMDFEIRSGLNLKADSGAKLDFLSADLKLVPKSGINQKVLDIDIFSDPKAEIKDEETIRYIWKKINSKYIYGVKSKVRVENNIVKIKSKINFPYDPDEYNEFLQETEFIDIDLNIRDKANEVIKGENDYYAVVFKVSDWVQNNIKYDLNTITAKAVKKSSWVLENRQGVCDELTNLFISMLRSVGIPARFVTGMVYTNIDDSWGSHGWAEVYFPDKGWIPWDVTFGQFGWIDPSHVRLVGSVDSGESSVDYKWRSYNVEVTADDLILKTDLFEEGEKFGEMVRLQVKSLEKDVKFGSYLPIIVTVENLQDYYLSDTIVLTKGPNVDNNVKNVLLKPKEIKTVYWISKVPSDLDNGNVYTAVLETKDSFGSISINEVIYSSEGEDIDFDEASSYADNLIDRDEKELLTDVRIGCDYEEREYHSNEEIKIKCIVKNIGNVMLSNLNFCLERDCSSDDLGIGESKELDYLVDISETILFSVENSDLIKKENLKFEVVNIPNIYISGISPKEVDYGVDTDVRLVLSSDFEARNVVIYVRGLGEVKYDSIADEEVIEFNINSKELVSGLHLDISYEDLKANKYNERKNFPIIVKNTPFYMVLWSRLKVTIERFDN